MNINQYKREHQKHVKRIEELERQVEQVDSLRMAALTEQQTAFQAKIDEQFVRLNKQINSASDLAISRQQQEESAKARIDELATQLENVEGQLATTTLQRNEAWHKLDNHAPAIEQAESKVKDLQALLAKVQDRMKRKELEEQSAILNRQAMPRLTSR